MPVTLRDERVVVLGGTSGIGLAAAQAVRALDGEVIVTGRDEGKLRAAAAALGEGATAQRVDANERVQLDEFFAGLGHLDHLVLTVTGPAGRGRIATLDVADLRTGFENKFWPYVDALQAALPLIRSPGSVTFVTAASAGAALPGAAGLAAVNGALEAMVPALAVELKPIRVNAVSPGVVKTTWWNFIPEDDREAAFAELAAVTPVGRVGAPEDIAQAILSVITNGFITGTVLTVDGGFTLSPPTD